MSVWVLGVALLLLITCSFYYFLSKREDEASPEIWDIGGTARTYTTIVGTLAAFSVTSSIFIANLTVARQSAAFESVMALFLTAFMIFISAAMQFATTPNLANPPGQNYRAVQSYSYLLANASFYQGLCLSWLGLPLLLSAVGLEYLADVFVGLVLFAILGGAMRISSSGLNILARADYAASLSMPFVCFAAAAFYRLVLGDLLDDLLPGEHGPALFAVVCFVVAAAGFSLQSALVGALRRESLSTRAARLGRVILIAFTPAVFTTSSLLWLAVKASL
jgi:hypothetical protein